MDKDVLQLYSGTLLSHKKEVNNAICNNMDRPRDYQTLREVTQKDKYHMISFICGILKHGTNELIYKTEIESQL